MAPPTASSVAPGWVCRSRASWRACWVATSRSKANPAKAACFASSRRGSRQIQRRANPPRPSAPLATRAPLTKDAAAKTASAPRAAAVPDDRDSIRNPDRVLLIIEDDVLFAGVICDLARELGFDCLIATTADEGIELASQFRLSAVVLDVKLPDHSGLTVLD